MRDSYQATSASYGTAPMILFILCLMAGMVGYLAAFGETLRESPTARIYITDMPEQDRNPVSRL